MYRVESHPDTILLLTLGNHAKLNNYFKQLHKVLFPGDVFEQLILNELTQKLVVFRNNSLGTNQYCIPGVTVLMELETK